MGSDSSWIRELDRNLTLTGTGQELDLDWNWTGESDRWDRTRRGSGNWNLCF